MQNTRINAAASFFAQDPFLCLFSQLIMCGTVSLVKTQRSYVNIIVCLAVYNEILVAIGRYDSFPGILPSCFLLNPFCNEESVACIMSESRAGMLEILFCENRISLKLCPIYVRVGDVMNLLREDGSL